MKILIAMDSFKGCLTSIDAGNAVREGILKVDPHANISLCPLADGGEGTVDALCCREDGAFIDLVVTGPLGDPVRSRYGILHNKVAVMEIASAAGLPLIPEEKRNPLYTTTFGVGEMIRDAIGRGIREFIIGLGGSATNDGGVGMLSALGWKFQDHNGERISFGAVGLKNLAVIASDEVLPELSECKFRIACDVTNPLLGENGCSAVFAPQKGGDAESIERMDRWLESYSRFTKMHFPTADPYAPGVGAAGGLGFAFSVFLGGILESGADIVGNFHNIEEKISHSDLVITGEGCLDGQFFMGKGPMYITNLCQKYSKPAIALVGAIGAGAEESLSRGLYAYFSIQPAPLSLSEALDSHTAFCNLRDTASQVYRLFRI